VPKESIASKMTSPFSCRHGRLKAQDAAPQRNTGGIDEFVFRVSSQDSGERGSPEGKGKMNLECRPYGAFLGEGAGTRRGPLRRLRKVSRQGGLLELVTKQIEVIGIGADLKRPGKAAALVGCIGEDGRYKDRDKQNQDQDTQSFHFQTSSMFFAYLMKPPPLSIGSTGIGKLIQKPPPYRRSPHGSCALQ
jgi:hypothetical protein